MRSRVATLFAVLVLPPALAAAPVHPSSARISFAPVVTPRAKGVVVAFAF